MKNIFLGVLLAACSTVFSQVEVMSTDTLNTDTTTMLLRNPSRDRFIFNVHWDGWLDAPDSLGVKGLSSGVGFHFYYDIPFGAINPEKATFSFAVGIGYSASNYYNKAYFTYDTTADVTSVVPFSTDVTIKTNKLVLNYVEVPLEFRFRSKENNKGNSFKLAFGFKGGYVFTNHTKFVGEDYLSNTADDIKLKQYRLHNLNKIQYGPTFRIGYGNINLQGYYGLNTIFEEGKGPSGTPLIIGISFNPF